MKNESSGALFESYQILKDVLLKGSFVNIALGGYEGENRARVTRIVYGTLEHYYELEYIINSLSRARPKPQVGVLLLQSIYIIKYLLIPAYTVISESLNILEKEGRGVLKNYAHALLAKVSRGEYALPKEGDAEYLKVKYNLPDWLIGKIKKNYPDRYESVLTVEPIEEEHFRPSFRMSKEEFDKISDGYRRTETGFYARNDEKIKKLINRGMLTTQSHASTLAVKAFGDVSGKSVIDVCASPGGKSVYLAERGAEVTACDIHEHRLALIENYAKRMGVKLKKICKADAEKPVAEWLDAFDCVLADVPCSGLGVLAKRRDIAFNRSADDIKTIAGIQIKILSNVARYVKKGGVIIYSTCTLLKEENGKIVETFLKENPNFKPLDIQIEDLGSLNTIKDLGIQILPDKYGTDGFYICKMERI